MRVGTSSSQTGSPFFAGFRRSDAKTWRLAPVNEMLSHALLECDSVGVVRSEDLKHDAKPVVSGVLLRELPARAPFDHSLMIADPLLHLIEAMVE